MREWRLYTVDGIVRLFFFFFEKRNSQTIGLSKSFKHPCSKKKKKKRKENKLLQSFWRFPGKGILSIQTSIEMIYSKVQTLTLITLTIV